VLEERQASDTFALVLSRLGLSRMEAVGISRSLMKTRPLQLAPALILGWTSPEVIAPMM
jgi:hypothetical protein